MCMNCGCMKPNDDHGNPSNITMEDLRAAGGANDQDLDTTIENIEKTYHQAEGSEGSGSRHEHAY